MCEASFTHDFQTGRRLDAEAAARLIAGVLVRWDTADVAVLPPYMRHGLLAPLS
jgi:hypothetical protein